MRTAGPHGPWLTHGTLVVPFGPWLEGLEYLFVHPEGTAADPALAALRAWLRAPASS